MVHCITKEDGTAIIVCNSMSTDIFKKIENAVPLISQTKEQHRVIESEGAPKGSYWAKATQNASRYGISTMDYLGMEKLGLPERDKEYGDMLAQTTGNISFTNLIKHSMIKVSSEAVKTVKGFFEKVRTPEKVTEKERE